MARSKIQQLRDEYKGSLKSSDTEEWFDLIFYRPIGFCWAVLARKAGIHPNAITIASIFIGIASGIAFYFDNFWINCIGVLLLVWANSYDSADGQLARMTGQYSRIGRILDGVSSDLWFVAIYIAICLRENYTSAFFMDHRWAIWLLAALAGICHAQQAAMADIYRQFHLFFLKGKSGSELEDAQALWKKYHSMSWRKEFWGKLVMGFYANYTRTQERCTPRMQALRRLLNKKYHDHIPQSFADRFRELSRPLMKYTNILSFNVRSWALFISILVLRMPWVYFAFEVTVMNVILLYMVLRHEKMCKSLTDFVTKQS
ncbi:MAG: CDP-alcohol phosphatidyltransferase family protein [Muribaculaceae bacterium]|nr:CDP-alcohol phosphatidyltransferase family protein [Muribaculaceae bacterium]